jgi:DNA-binding PadR family transcriptional regulator
MHNPKDGWDFSDFFAGFTGKAWGGPWASGRGRSGGRRNQMFESGEVKFVILRLLKEKPRHGYEVIKALEEKMGGCYTPSAGTVYPTLQLLEDQGYIKGVDTDGKKVYQITPEGEAFLEDNRDVLEDIIGRVRDTVRDFTGGSMGELHSAFGRVAKATFKRAWRKGPEDPAIQRVTEILARTAQEIEQAWENR